MNRPEIPALAVWAVKTAEEQEETQAAADAATVSCARNHQNPHAVFLCAGFRMRYNSGKEAKK